MNELKFVTVKGKRKYHKLLERIMLPYCRELDRNVVRETPEETLKRFIASIVVCPRIKTDLRSLAVLMKI